MKTLYAVLIVFAVFSFIGSCSSDEGLKSGFLTGNVSLNVDFFEENNGEEKGLMTVVSSSLASSSTDAFYWRYTLVKKDSYGLTGQKTAETVLNGGAKGLPNSLGSVSAGKWEITLFAYIANTYKNYDIIYASKPVLFEVKVNYNNEVAVSVSRLQKAGTTGRLIIDPKKISVAINAGSVSVTKTYLTQSNIYNDFEAYKNMFGALSEYSYKIYECNADWTIKSTLINSTADKASDGTVVAYDNASASVGSHYIKIEVFRTGYDEAEKYIAMVIVEVYSNCTTQLQNDGDGDYSGIIVKRLKEFKVIYYDWGSSDNLPFTGEHQNVYVDPGDEEDSNTLLFTSYTQTHQYGRTEELDEPVREGRGFAGYYTTYNGTKRITSIPAYEYRDVKLYAKWDTKCYSSISYDNNFPVKALKRGTGMTGYSGSYSTSTPDDKTVPVMPVDPSCEGYLFKGWQADASHFGYSNVNGLPEAWMANQAAVCKAQWEPIRYKVVVRCHSTINPVTDFENYAAIHEQVARLASNWSYYDTEYSIIDPQTSKFGFLGYKIGNSNAADESNYVYDPDNVAGLDNSYMNLTTENFGTVYVYALFSDYFTPLEYIRSKPASGDSGPLIDTLVKCNLTDSGASRMVADIELAGQEFGGRGFVCGSSASPYNFLLATTGDRNGYWRWWSGGTEGVVSDGCKDTGLYFEDQRYLVDMYIDNSVSVLKIDGVTVESLPHSSSSFHNGNIVFFGWSNNTGDTYNHRGDVRIFSALLYNNRGNVVRRFQPCVLKKDVPGAFSSTGAAITRTSDTEIGLWDLKTNKFYPNIGQGRFYQPSEEVTVTFYANYTDAEVESRSQKILKSVSDKLHKNVISKPNSQFQGWMTAPNKTLLDYVDRDNIAISSDTKLYALWTQEVSYNLFGQVEYLESTGVEYIDVGTNHDTSTRYYGEAMVPSQTKTGDWYFLFGSRNDWPETNAFNMQFRQNNGYLGFNIGSKTNNAAVNIGYNNKYSFSYSYNKVIINNTTINTGATTLVNAPHNDIVFGIYVKVLTGQTFTTDENGVVAIGVKRFYWLKHEYNGEVAHDFVPAVLTEDLTSSSNVFSARHGMEVKGNTKVSTGKDCYKGEAGFWELKTDIFYPNYSGKGAFNYPTNSFLIRYDANGGIGNMEDHIITSTADFVGERLRENRFESNGYEFIGWNTMPDGSGKWYSDERVIHKSELKNMTLFAQWKEVMKNVPYEELDYIQNQGTGGTGLAYINTGIRADNSFRYYLKYIRVTGSSGSSGSCNIIGGYYPGHVHLNGVIYVMGSSYATVDTFGSLFEVDAGRYNNLVDARYTKNASQWVSAALGSVNNTAASSNVLNSTWSLFARYPDISDGGSSKIYAFKLWNGEERLVRNYIPVMLTEDIPASKGWDNKAHKNGELGLWDKCENKFYSNANSKGYFSNDQLQLIEYKANGGTGDMPIQAFRVSVEKRALNKNAFIGSGGCRFIGWNTAADGTGVWYHDKYETNAWEGGLLTLYAQWEDTPGGVNIDYFEPVNYIKTNGQAIITKVYAVDTGQRMSMRFKFDSFNCVPFGAQITTGGDKRNMLYLSDSSHMRIDCLCVGTNTVISPTWTTTKIHSFTLSDNVLTIDGKTYTGTKGSTSINGYNAEICLFMHGTASRGFLARGCCYGAEISNGTVIARLVPCRLTKKISSYEAGKLSSDGATHKVGEIGMWDIENNIFYANINSGSFTCELN